MPNTQHAGAIPLFLACSQDSDLARFDPYKILDIDIGSTDKQIKRAYKIKALEYHPDKVRHFVV